MGNRYYPIGDKGLASVTTITGLADKSDALIPWAVGLAVDYVKQSAVRNNSTDTDNWYTLSEKQLESARTEWRTVRDEAGDIGTQVHDLLEGYLIAKQAGKAYAFVLDNDIPDETQKQIIALYKAAIEKLESIGPYTVLATEAKVVNEDEWYAGRFDALLEVDWETWLIDFKTGGAFYPEWGMQLAAYAEAWEESECERCACLEEEEMSCVAICKERPIDRIKILRLDKKTLKAHWKDYSDQRSVLYRAFLGLRDAFYILKAKKSAREAFLNGSPTD